MTWTEKLSTIKDNVPKVYEAGRQNAYSEFFGIIACDLNLTTADSTELTWDHLRAIAKLLKPDIHGLYTITVPDWIWYDFEGITMYPDDDPDRISQPMNLYEYIDGKEWLIVLASDN